MNKLRDPKIRGQVRHVFSAVGILLAQQGYVSGVVWELGLGIGIAGLVLWDSWTAPEKK